MDAAAALFATQGYSATTTRQIAERAGVRQASLYYHVAGKSQILLELLEQTVRPTLDALQGILDLDDPAVALARLAAADVRTLLDAPHQLAVLYTSPEISGPEFDAFRADRERLRDAYVGLVGRIGRVPDPGFTGSCCLQLVELATELRLSGHADASTPARIADACLRLAGVADDTGAPS